MSDSAIENELIEATGLKTKKGETRQAFLERLCKAGAKLPDDAWEGLSSEAQKWNNGAAADFKAGKVIDDFEDLQSDDEEQDEEAVSDTTPSKEWAATKGNGKPKVAKEKKEPAAKTHAPRKVSACHTIKKMVVKNPKITVAELSEQLKEDGLKVSDVTIATLRSDLRDTLRVLNETGHGVFQL